MKQELAKDLLELWQQYVEETGESCGEGRIVKDTLLPFMRWIENKSKSI